MFGGRLGIDPAGLIQESSALHLVPVLSGAVPVYDGSGIAEISFLSGPTDQSHVFNLAGLPAGKCYDVWAICEGGVAVIGLVAWSDANPFGSTPLGAAPFGPGPYSTSEAIRLCGVPVNESEIAVLLTNGETRVVDPWHATFLGSIRIAPCGGKISCNSEIGECRKWGVWNAHNQRRTVLKGTLMRQWRRSLYDHHYQHSPSWSVALNGSEQVSLEVFAGRPMSVSMHYYHHAFLQANGAAWAAIVQNAIGWNSKTRPSGFWQQHGLETINPTNVQVCAIASGCARLEQPYANGVNTIYPLVKTTGVVLGAKINTGKSVVIQWGEEYDMLLTAEWWG